MFKKQLSFDTTYGTEIIIKRDGEQFVLMYDYDTEEDMTLDDVRNLRDMLTQILDEDGGVLPQATAHYFVKGPHSRACGPFCKGHGVECHASCPTCSGRPVEELVYDFNSGYVLTESDDTGDRQS